MDYSLPIYEKPKAWIDTARENNIDWDDIRLARRESEQELLAFLKNQQLDNFWPKFDADLWYGLVELKKEEEADRKEKAGLRGDTAVLSSVNLNNDLTIPANPRSAWKLYRKKLSSKGFKESTINDIERACIKTLRCLSYETKADAPIKGMVVGNVQSGKTANMAGLMAMAADWGWNMFIVFSGTIENLRLQTVNRLFNDLNNDRCNLSWRALSNDLSTKSPIGERAQDLNFSSNSRQRYLTVCLKNSTRLKNLIQWLQKDPSAQRQMKVLLIEDEADQASINTKDINGEERSRINSLLCNLVNGNDIKGHESEEHFAAMNYIGYTATPYANLLNESNEESLYPRSFITSLKTSNEYFGPQQIFGIEGGDYDGLDIVRKVSENDCELISDIHKSSFYDKKFYIPQSLSDSICWFICCVACARYWGITHPISMLIHTSQFIPNHENVERAIIYWFENHSSSYIISQCRSIWIKETQKFDKSTLREQYPDYGIDDENIKDCPNFDLLIGYINVLLSEHKISHIKLDEDNNPIYTKHIHVCVDNSSNNGVSGDEYVRLLLPEHELDFAPAFLVIGGSTLSRGITIDGLVSTYFLRTARQADTLMQMGRWFGYRKGYELLPRIWMTETTKELFKFLSVLDHDLRNQIRVMELNGKTPLDYALKLKYHSKKFRITGKNRDQDSDFVDMDFSGTLLQTFLFDKDKDVLNYNLQLTKNFITNLGHPDEIESCNSNNKIWSSIQFDIIKEYLQKFKVQSRVKYFNYIDVIFEWVEKNTAQRILEDWNVILVSKNDSTKNSKFDFGDYSINKVTRTLLMKEEDNSLYNIGVLRAPGDIKSDIDLSELSDEEKVNVIAGLKSPEELRHIYGCNKIPQLLVYIIDKDSKAKEGSRTRKDLNALVDLAGFCINIPSDVTTYRNGATVAVRLRNNIIDDIETDIED